MCTPGSSAPRRVARHSRDRQNPSTNAAPTKMPHSSSRRETSLEIAKAIGLWPLRAPSRPPRTATQPSPHTTSRATWDSGISLHRPPVRASVFSVVACARRGPSRSNRRGADPTPGGGGGAAPRGVPHPDQSPFDSNRSKTGPVACGLLAPQATGGRTAVSAAANHLQWNPGILRHALSLEDLVRGLDAQASDHGGLLRDRRVHRA